MKKFLFIKNIKSSDSTYEESKNQAGKGAYLNSLREESMLEHKSSNSQSKPYPLRGLLSTGLLIIPLTHQTPNASCFSISETLQHNH